MTRTREENAADLAHEEDRARTKAVTIAALIAELVETDMSKCDDAFDHPDDRVPHVISEVHGTSASISSIGTTDMGASHLIELSLDDGTSFTIRVEKA